MAHEVSPYAAQTKFMIPNPGGLYFQGLVFPIVKKYDLEGSAMYIG